jgi:phosphoribosylanthranilate isomerase
MRAERNRKQPRAYRFMLEENLVQVAGVIDTAEAQLLQQCGVRYLGFPLRLPVHREDLTEQDAAAIINSLAPPVFGVLITYLSEASEIAAFCDELGARIVQLHGDIDQDELKRLKPLDPNLTVIKSLVIGCATTKLSKQCCVSYRLSSMRSSPIRSIQTLAHQAPPARLTTGA